MVGPVDQVGRRERLVVGRGPARVAVGCRVQVVPAVEERDVRVGEQAGDDGPLRALRCPRSGQPEGAVRAEPLGVLKGLHPQLEVAVPQPPVREVERHQRHRARHRTLGRAESRVPAELRCARVGLQAHAHVPVAQEHPVGGLQRVARRRRQSVDDGERGVRLGLRRAAGTHRVEPAEVVGVPEEPAGVVHRLQRPRPCRQSGRGRRRRGQGERRGDDKRGHREQTRSSVHDVLRSSLSGAMKLGRRRHRLRGRARAGDASSSESCRSER